ncbi:tripartite tricarboxylate transporter permease [Pseudonocardia nematodicida]|uniref:Tripartite tricarboxylate transporter permease n=1 Tax=Pseudonocardia nematodicida TaxID=1206997 RepID=A0ABV1KGM3_9PSEU
MGAIVDVITIEAVVALALGSAFGLLIGAVPGLTAMMGMALLLPLTFGMSSTAAIALLVGCYIGGIAGGLVSSTLLGMPGNSSSIATTFDAYPMAKKGEPVKALGIGVTASLFGGLLGFAALISLSPVVASVALLLGPFEYFSITLLALMLVAVLAGNNMAKGLAAGFLGLLAGSIGFAPIDSSERFTFGWSHLWGGIAILPLIIGLFAISEMMRVTMSEGRETPKVPVRYSGFGLGIGIADVVRSGWNIVRSSLIGIAIGVLPGMGGTAANLLAYARAKQAARNPDEFGKGAADGIWAPESSNSASSGGSMVPMMTLGIPGDGVTAVLLGGLIIHGIQPGPLLFSENPEVVNAIFFYFLIAVVVVFAMQLFGMRVFPLVLRVPKRYLFPILVAFMAVGAYAASYQIADAWLMVALGVIGFGLVAGGFPLSPLLLGYILGPIVETYFRRALMSSDGDYTPFITRPASAVFIGATVLVLVVTFWSRARASRTPTPHDRSPTSGVVP